MSLYNLLTLVAILLSIILIIYLKNFKCRHKWEFVERRSLTNKEGQRIKTNNISICIHCGCYKRTDIPAR